MAAVELGRKGGSAVFKNRGVDYMKKIAKRGAEARWGSKKKSKSKNINIK